MDVCCDVQQKDFTADKTVVINCSCTSACSVLLPSVLFDVDQASILAPM